MDWVQPAWVSDHLCWTGVAHRNVHDLLPVPYTEEALKHIIQRIRDVQDFLGRRIALENPSTYLEFKSSSIPEAEFITRMAQEADCHLLLDVNNIYVSCFNHRLDAKGYIDAMPLDRVAQIHLAGHDNQGTHIVDTHDNHVVDEVWALYKYTINKAQRVPNTMIEWDDKIPTFDVLYNELEKARVAASNADDYGTLPDLAAPRTTYLPNIITAIADEQERMQQAILLGFAKNPDTWIKDKEKFSPKDQLDVYIKAYRYRLYGIVAEDYPVLTHYLGAEKFEALLWKFIDATPSQHFNVGRYATAFPAFIARECPDDKMALELCRLETAITQLADAEETPALSLEDIAALTADEFMAATLHLRKALQLMAFTYPINQYYREVMEGKEPPTPQPQASWLLLLRHDDTMWRADLEKDEYALLTKLCAKVSVQEALEGLADTVAEKISQWFGRWMRYHIISTIEQKGVSS